MASEETEIQEIPAILRAPEKGAPPPAAPAPKPAKLPPNHFQLRKPVTGHQGQIRKIILAEPTADALFDLGLPFRFIQDPQGRMETIIEGPVFRRWLNRLAQTEGPDGKLVPVDAGTLGDLAMQDVARMRDWLAEQLTDTGDDLGN